MVVIEVRHRQGGEADEEEKEKEEKEEKEEKRKAADIKSNNPHLAGGEKERHGKSSFFMVIQVVSMASHGASVQRIRLCSRRRSSKACCVRRAARRVEPVPGTDDWTWEVMEFSAVYLRVNDMMLIDILNVKIN